MTSHRVSLSGSTSIVNAINKYSSTVNQVSEIETFRVTLSKFMATSSVGLVYTNFLLFLSVLSSLQFIVQTYLNANYVSDQSVLQAFSKIEITLAALFAFDWFLFLFLADRKGVYFFSFFAIIDFVTVIPIWLTNYVYKDEVSSHNIHNFSSFMNFLLYGAHRLRILRALRLRKKLLLIQDEVKRILLNMLLTVLTMILFEAALMQYFERDTQNLPFHVWVYYLVVTTATVGYGDISPQTTIGKMWAICIIVTAVILLPMMTNELIAKMNRYSVYARLEYHPQGYNKHIVICGDIESVSLLEFFEELFHEDHENDNLHAVILSSNPPTLEYFEVLRNPRFAFNIHYLEGSPLNEVDLIRTKATSAVAFFLLSNKFTSSPDEEDAKIILQLLSIKRFIRKSFNSDPLYCTQLIRPENKRHVSTDDLDNERDIVLCLNELKMGVIAKTVLFPGFATLIFNLLSSFSEEDGEEAEKESRMYESGADDFTNETWVSEYRRGCDWEVYSTPLATVFEGRKFIEIAGMVYESLGVLLFALKIRELEGAGSVKVLLNPAEYVIPSKTKFQIEGFVFAQNKASSNLSFAEQTSAVRKKQLSNIAEAMSKKFESTTNAIRRESAVLFSGLRNENHRKVLPDSRKSRWQTISQHVNSAANMSAEDIHHNQEKLQYLEDQKLRAKYYVRDAPVSLEHVTIKTSLLEQYPQMNRHIIITGKGMNNLYDLIKPLRAKSLGRKRYIILLHPHDIPHSVWQRISIFDGILYVRGSPLEEIDLRRSGVFRATQVVVLSDPVIRNRNSVGVDAMNDAEAIFAYQCVKRLNRRADVVIEIVHHQSISYLEDSKNVEQVADYRFTPQFAAGTLFTSSILDSIICQAFYNPQIIHVINKLIASNEDIQLPTNPLVAARKAKTSASQGSSLYQIPIPDGFQGKPYIELVRHFAKDGILILGLLRGFVSRLNIGARSNRMPYVYTNPPQDSEIFATDKVFVLSTKPLLTRQSLKDLASTTYSNFSSLMPDEEEDDGLLVGEKDGLLTTEDIKKSLKEIRVDQEAFDKIHSALFDEVMKLAQVAKELEGTTLSRSGSRQRLHRNNSANRSPEDASDVVPTIVEEEVSPPIVSTDEPIEVEVTPSNKKRGVKGIKGESREERIAELRRQINRSREKRKQKRDGEDSQDEQHQHSRDVREKSFSPVYAMDDVIDNSDHETQAAVVSETPSTKETFDNDDGRESFPLTSHHSTGNSNLSPVRRNIHQLLSSSINES